MLASRWHNNNAYLVLVLRAMRRHRCAMYIILAIFEDFERLLYKYVEYLVCEIIDVSLLNLHLQSGTNADHMIYSQDCVNF